jgi:hypothetical protein
MYRVAGKMRGFFAALRMTNKKDEVRELWEKKAEG